MIIIFLENGVQKQDGEKILSLLVWIGSPLLHHVSNVVTHLIDVKGQIPVILIQPEDWEEFREEYKMHVKLSRHCLLDQLLHYFSEMFLPLDAPTSLIDSDVFVALPKQASESDLHKQLRCLLHNVDLLLN